MQLVKRTIEIWYDPDLLQFNSPERYQAFHNALGFMCFYGMDTAKEDTTVNGIMEYTNIYKDGKPLGREISQLVLTYKNASDPIEKRGFTMGAVSREDGIRYSFHS